MNIFPVIHHHDVATTLNEVVVARSCGAHGVFLISHGRKDTELAVTARRARAAHPDFQLGLNLLSMPAPMAAEVALDEGMDMLWADDMGVSSAGLTDMGQEMAAFAAAHPGIQCFAGVAFKHQRFEPMPVRAALNAQEAGFVPTTSGAATGQAPDVEKVRTMGEATLLAVASGITPHNVLDYAPYIEHVLVATGISRPGDLIDPDKLKSLVARCADFERRF